MKTLSVVLLAILVILGVAFYVETDRINRLSREVVNLSKEVEFDRNLERTSQNNIETLKKQTLSKGQYFHLLRSTVKITSPLGSYGSGVVLFSERRPVESEDYNYYTYVLTCAHVTQGFDNVSVEHLEYRNDRDIESTNIFPECDVVAADEDLDLAIVLVKSLKDFPDTAVLEDQKSYEGASLSDSVFVCGCGLGSDPYITYGNFASFESYYGRIQITAPVIFGNSGGGAYTSDGKLIGIVNKMKASNSSPLYPRLPYPHAGLLVPFWKISGWIKMSRLGFTIGESDESSIETAIEMLKEKRMLELEKMLKDFFDPPSPEQERQHYKFR